MPQKSKSSKVSSKKGNYVKNPAPDDDPQKLANDSPISEEQTDRIGETGSVLTTKPQNTSMSSLCLFRLRRTKELTDCLC